MAFLNSFTGEFFQRSGQFDCISFEFIIDGSPIAADQIVDFS